MQSMKTYRLASGALAIFDGDDLRLIAPYTDARYVATIVIPRGELAAILREETAAMLAGQNAATIDVSQAPKAGVAPVQVVTPTAPPPATASAKAEGNATPEAQAFLAAVASLPEGQTLTVDQRKLLGAAATGADLTPDQFKKLLADTYGKPSTDGLSVAQGRSLLGLMVIPF